MVNLTSLVVYIANNLQNQLMKINLSIKIFVILLMLGLNAGFAGTFGGVDNIIVPVKHPVYHFLDRMETRGFMVYHGGTKPLSRGEIRELLGGLKTVEGELPGSERGTWARYMHEFDTEGNSRANSSLSRLRQTIWPASPLYRDGYNLYSFTSGGVYGAVNPVLYFDFVTDSTENLISRMTNGLNFIAGFGDNIGVYFDFRDNMERGRGTYYDTDRDKLYSDHAAYVTLQGGNAAYYDLTRAVLSAKFGKLRLNFGRGDNFWGSNDTGGLLLSDNPPPYDYLSLRYDAGKFLRFSYVSGWLHAYPEIYESAETTSAGRIRKISAAKHFSAHRLEIYPAEWIEIGIMEAVVYGERGVEPSYLNPFNLYYSAEHNLGDMDNVAWGADLAIRPAAGVSLYGELFIDDLKTGKLGTDYIGNKFAYLGGVKLAGPGRMDDFDLNLEYSRLDPFVYTHFYEINVYKNWNSSLGYFLPPNSDRWYLGLEWRPLYTLSAEISAEFIRHGDNTAEINAGGDLDFPPEYDQRTAQFLAGERNDVTIYQLSAKWEPFEAYSIGGKIRRRDFRGGGQWEWQTTFGVNVW